MVEILEDLERKYNAYAELQNMAFFNGFCIGFEQARSDLLIGNREGLSWLAPGPEGIAAHTPIRPRVSFNGFAVWQRDGRVVAREFASELRSDRSRAGIAERAALARARTRQG